MVMIRLQKRARKDEQAGVLFGMRLSTQISHRPKQERPRLISLVTSYPLFVASSLQTHILFIISKQN